MDLRDLNIDIKNLSAIRPWIGFSGKVLKNEASGNDLLSSYNSNHSVIGSTQFGAGSYNFGIFSVYLAYRIWDV